MTYFKVKPAADQIRVGIRTVEGFLIKDELFTETEINNAISAGRISNAFKEKNFDKIELSKHKTYWMFGARFQCK